MIDWLVIRLFNYLYHIVTDKHLPVLYSTYSLSHILIIETQLLFRFLAASCRCSFRCPIVVRTFVLFLSCYLFSCLPFPSFFFLSLSYFFLSSYFLIFLLLPLFCLLLYLYTYLHCPHVPSTRTPPSHTCSRYPHVPSMRTFTTLSHTIRTHLVHVLAPTHDTRTYTISVLTGSLAYAKLLR